MHIQYVQQPTGLRLGPQTRISGIKQAVSPCVSILLENFNKLTQMEAGALPRKVAVAIHDGVIGIFH
jgi:hypothetical protein